MDYRLKRRRESGSLFNSLADVEISTEGSGDVGVQDEGE